MAMLMMLWLELEIAFPGHVFIHLDGISGYHVDQLQIWGHALIAWSVLQVRILIFFLKSSIFLVKNEI